MALCRERGPLRAVLSRIAFRLVELRAWERLGYARLSDYVAECLGLSARWVRDLAAVGRGLHARPRLEHALASGRLGWTKVRLLARLPREEDEGAWIAHAGVVTAEELSKQVRAVDLGSVEAGAAEEEGARSGLFEVRCSPEVRWKWHAARAAVESGSFARGYRTGALSWVKADVLVPLVRADPLGWFVGDWVAWAGRVTVRRLRDDVEQALALEETDREAFRRCGGLPPEARGDRQIGAAEMGAGGDPWGASTRGSCGAWGGRPTG